MRSIVAGGAAALIIVLSFAPLASATPPAGWSAATRLGFPGGDDWEPSIAADAYGHVYSMWTHYQGFDGGTAGDPDPTCPACGNPHMDLQVSADNGATWSAPRVLSPTTTRQDDPQIVVDPADGRTVYASFMQDNKSSQYVAKSTDFGVTWQVVLVEPLQRGTDKDILAVRGANLYLVYHTQEKTFVSVSHDSGTTWSTHTLVGTTNSELGVSFPSGGAVDSNGVVYFAWNGVTKPGQAKGSINLYVTKSTDLGATWTVSTIDVSGATPDCGCDGYDFWGAQMALGVDAANRVYVLWNANRVKNGPQRVYFKSSPDGASWSSAVDVSAAPAGANHTFPALVAGAAGDVRIAWMDDRNGHDGGNLDANARWNVYYRSSTNGGSSWSNELKLSRFVAGFGYKLASPKDGFSSPYGDYFEIDINAAGGTVALWGEGFSWTGPGNIWFARQT